MGDSTSLHLLDGRTSAHALTYGMLRASRTLELDASLLQSILATDADRVARLLDSQSTLDPDSPEGLRALRLVRLHRALGDVFGSSERVHRFLDTVAPELGTTPRALLGTADGIERVLACVERDVRDSLDPGFAGALIKRTAAV
ncbi:MAG TPA: antitoxin Xre/MbcA/ParS toxin-binding domain-containing protein [Lysobacter sp.]|nr:antitoxin Xre/MbcA/ParS toxin-binding domain-containing protein [Lysobacter sp.]